MLLASIMCPLKNDITFIVVCFCEILLVCSTWTSVMTSNLPLMWLVNSLDSQESFLLLFLWTFLGENRCVQV